MNELVLDIKILIASYDDTVWARLYAYDNEFKLYAESDVCINMFISLFWKETINDGLIRRTIFEKLHSFYDIPAYIQATIPYNHYSDTKKWYQNGILHREHNRPAIVDDGVEKYYMNGIPYTKRYNIKRKSSRNKQSANKRHKLR